ncbi:unnamed protein product [Linum tenue]|uniref:Uncharacterized protein n=1 Tax=Linum tenue TaxID=586396 RepID=A0AAV0PFC7_9ROSI|nr:unnamed protein product [Linum tenue]
MHKYGTISFSKFSQFGGKERQRTSSTIDRKRGMATTSSSILAATILVLFGLSFAAANWGEEAPTSELIHVSGKVLCQDCQMSYKDWISGERPIKGSTVSLTCMDDRKRVHHYDSDVTDERVLTDFAGGKSGVKLSQPTSVYRGTTKYDVGSFYYTHPMCERPEVGESDGKSGGDDDQEYYRYPETKY